MISTPSIPEPRLQTVINYTPFVHFQADKMAVGRKLFDTVVLKGTFKLAPGKLVLADKQLDIVFADEPYEPEHADRSSLRRAGDVILTKTTTDVIVTGTARAPSAEPIRSWEAGVRVTKQGETKIDYRARALGPRHFRHGEKGWALTEPEPALGVPIRYDLAYGGAYPAPPPKAGGEEGWLPWVVYKPNPSGTGFVDEGALHPSEVVPGPQWEPCGQPVTKLNQEVPLAGFGPVARPWESRLKYAGTYDDAWMKRTREEIAQGLPADYAADFDPRFFQCAHPELIAPEYFMGDEEITLTGLMPGPEPFSFQLPGLMVVANLRDGEDNGFLEVLRLDTVVIDLDEKLVSLSFRLSLDQARDIRAAAFLETEVP